MGGFSSKDKTTDDATGDAIAARCITARHIILIDEQHPKCAFERCTRQRSAAQLTMVQMRRQQVATPTQGIKTLLPVRVPQLHRIRKWCDSKVWEHNIHVAWRTSKSEVTPKDERVRDKMGVVRQLSACTQAVGAPTLTWRSHPM